MFFLVVSLQLVVVFSAQNMKGILQWHFEFDFLLDFKEKSRKESMLSLLLKFMLF